MGDMNISPTDLDIGIGEENRKRWLRTGKCSFLPEEREWMERLLGWGWWILSARLTRKRRTVSRGLTTALKASMTTGACVLICCWRAPPAERCIETGIDYDIRSMEKPSDHAPVWATFKL